jgi:hypothetical protein
MEKYDPQVVESCAIKVVDCIEEFIDALRSEFPLSLGSKQQDAPTQQILLYTRMEEKGLLQKVKSIIQKQEEKLGSNKFVNVFGLPRTAETLDQRYQLVHEIVIPLIHLLTQCYYILDQLPSSQPESQRTQTNSSKSKKKPLPPIGMLSIQNYTDIACLLEFTVLTNVLPIMESNVLIKSEERIRYHLPKSLAGRIPRTSLAWGSFQDDKVSHSKKRTDILQTVSAMASLLLLDRFKPMLLPRHLSDIYAAIFQAEQWKDTTGDQMDGTLQELYAKVGLTPKSRMDPSLQAKTYQVLLLRGTNAPDWLRRRVSPLLAQLACTNLAAIVQVFCPGQETSSASQRLGRALATAPSKKALSQQMLGLLQLIFPSNGNIPAAAMAILETIWAVLNQWSSDMIRAHVIQVWEKGIMGSESQGKQAIHATIRQIGALCCFVPNATNSLKVLQLIPQSIIFSHLVRLGSMPSVLACTARNDAKQTLHWISQAIYGLKQTANIGNETVSAQTLLVTAWVHSLAPCAWDFAGHQYFMIESMEAPANSLESLEIQHSENSITDLKSITGDGTRRADVYLEVTNFDNSTSTSMSGLHSRMFRLLLQLYLSSSMNGAFAPGNYQLVSILVLPMLFEKCSPEDLLFGDTDDAMGLLRLVKVVLGCVEIRLGNQFANNDFADGSEAVVGMEKEEMIRCLGELRTIVKVDDQSDDLSLLSDNDMDQIETTLSIASIILSLLISVLELGTKLRSIREEEMLKSLLPALESLAALNFESNKLGSLPTEESQAGMADMSGYAMALIASRGASVDDHGSDTPTPLSLMDKLKQIVEQAEKDLQSTEPPLRARGMVKLGRLARGYLDILSKESLEKENTPLIIELKEDDSERSEDNAIAFLIQEILRLSMVALSDKESYVYLAVCSLSLIFFAFSVVILTHFATCPQQAVQTVVAVGDMRPKEVLHVVASTVVSGVLPAGTHVTRSLSSDIEVSQEQRIKLADALIFIIRRRAIVDEFVPTMLSLMTFGSAERMSSKSNNDKKNDNLIQSETHKYFLGDEQKENDNELATQAEKWEDQDIRLRTGGPMFKLEEFDVVRAARASVIAELVSVSKPSVVAPHCRFLARLAIDALTLDSSRAVCRSVALLAREIYGCVLRELEEAMDAVNTSTNTQTETVMPLTVALVSCDEEMLFSTLQAHASSVGDASRRRVDDPATSTRCSEAINLRRQAEESGFLAASRLVLSQGSMANGIPDFLKMSQA